MELSEPGTVDIKSLHGFKKQLNAFMEEKYIKVPLACNVLEPSVAGVWKGVVGNWSCLFAMYLYLSVGFVVVYCQKKVISCLYNFKKSFLN